mmetsp:Transcript_100822/g.308251  ORF Transcript_100822/g.308251 Transcript_100822/m.308251 type:complete len:130 (-) Transcript_100822:111-500(-)
MVPGVCCSGLRVLRRGSWAAVSAAPAAVTASPRCLWRASLLAGQQVRRFSRDPKDGTESRVPRHIRIQEFKENKERFRDGWAWVGHLENVLEETNQQANKVRQRSHWPSNCPVAREAKANLRNRIWEKE